MMRVVFGGLGRGGEVGRFEEMAFVSMVFVVGDREKGPAYCGLVDWAGVFAGGRFRFRLGLLVQRLAWGVSARRFGAAGSGRYGRLGKAF